MPNKKSGAGKTTPECYHIISIANHKTLSIVINVDKSTGTIDEVRIYNIALTATQIQALYLAGLPKHRQ